MLFPVITFTQPEYNIGRSREIIGCDMIIYDYGGAGSPYFASRDDTITIKSSDPENPAIEIRIIEMDIDCNDTLFFYNAGSADPAYAVAMGSLGVPWYVGDHRRWLDGTEYMESVICSANPNMIIVGDWCFRSTILNPDGGAITIRFKTNESVERSGFKIEAKCKPLCQPTYSHIDKVSSYPPIIAEADGFHYINLCPYDSIYLRGNGIYPFNDYGGGGYHQEDDSSFFKWYINDEVIAGTGRDSLRYTLPPGHGSEVRLEVTDQRGCASMLTDYVRIRVSADPVSTVTIPHYACSGDSIALSVGYSLLNPVVVDTVRNECRSGLGFDRLLYIPDGPSCPETPECYEASVTFTEFEPGQVIESVNDILSICFTMEHSFLGDLQMSIVCPNLQEVVTHAQPNGGNRFLGQAVDDAAIGVCTPGPIGIGWNYCWSDNTDLGYYYNDMLHTGNTTYVQGLQGFSSGHAVDSTDRQGLLNYYHPFNNFSGLIGCPINGRWSFKICDKYQADDGWIWSWELNLDPGIVPRPSWDYEITIRSVSWEGPDIIRDSDTSSHISGITPGIHNYAFTILDTYNCEYKTGFVINTFKKPLFDLGEDIAVCGGTSVPIRANYYDSDIHYQWNTGAETENIKPQHPGTYMLTISKYAPDSSVVCQTSDSITISHYPQPAAFFTADSTEACSSLTFKLTDGTTPPDPSYLYSWSIDTAPFTYSSEPSPSFTLDEPGRYRVKLVIENESGCIDSITDPNFFVYPQPVAGFSVNRNEGCSPVDISLTHETLPFDSSYSCHWIIHSGSTGLPVFSPSSFTITEPGFYDVKLVVWNESGCIDSITKPDFIMVYPQPVADFTASPESSIIIESNGRVDFTNTSTFDPGDITWEWDFGDGSGISELMSPTYTYPTWGEFDVSLWITNSFGCSSEITRKITVDPEIEIPNVLTPNYDGINDVFAIKNLSMGRENLLSIYDRWGKKIYEQKNYRTYMKDDILYNAGDGFTPNELSNGTYYYTFIYKGDTKDFQYHGSLTVIR